VTYFRELRMTALFAAMAATLVLWAGCGSDSTVEPEPEPQTELFCPSIDSLATSRQVGYIYDWAGTGSPGGGATGQCPSTTALYLPQDVCFDAQGNPYVLDWNNHRVLDLDANGRFHLLIGGRFGDAPDGQADQIGLNHPTQVSFTSTGDLVLCAWHNSTLKTMDMVSGYIRTTCGSGARSYGGDGNQASAAILDLPVSAVFDADGNLYVSDQGNMIIRRIDTSGIITTIAGTIPHLEPPPLNWVYESGFEGDGGPANQAKLHFSRDQAANPTGKICIDIARNILYIADSVNHCIRAVTLDDGMIDTYAGQGTKPGYGGDGGQATAAAAFLRDPVDVACDAAGNLYIADSGNHCIRMVDTSGFISTVAGTPTVAGDDGNGVLATTARLDTPMGVAIGPSGNIWIIDTRNHRIRVVYQ